MAKDLITDLHDSGTEGDEPTVYGDNAYGTGAFQDHLENSNIESRCKTQQPVNTNGLFTKDVFDINIDDDTVTCPAQVTVSIRRNTKRQGTARFAGACTTCARRPECTTAKGGRTIGVGIHGAVLARASEQQTSTSAAASERVHARRLVRWDPATPNAHTLRRRSDSSSSMTPSSPKSTCNSEPGSALTTRTVDFKSTSNRIAT